MSATTLSIADKVARLTLDDGKANVFDNAMFDAVGAAIDEADAAKAVLVLRGRPGRFSGGYDLKTLSSSPEAARALVKRGSDLAIRFMERPHPVLLASDGHCVALGAFLFLGADYRIGAKGGAAGDFKVGLPETPFNLPMHNFGRELATHALPKRMFKRAFIQGEFFADPVEAGFYDEVAEDMDAAIDAKLAYLTQINTPTFANNKALAHKRILPVLKQAAEEDLSLGLEF